jgi:hypothetical protein
MPKPASVALALAMSLACLSATAQEPGAPPGVVRVTGVRAIPWKSYRAMRAGLAAYEKYKALAPDAEFSYGVVLGPGKKLPDNFAMRVLTSKGKEYPITMNGRLFALPMLPEDEFDADLVTNMRGFQIKVGIKLWTPAIPLDKYRLGDLRLSCEIDRAIDHVDDGVFAKLLAANKCDSNLGNYMTTAPLNMPTSGGYLVEGERSVMLARKRAEEGIYYAVPLYDQGWSNEALLEFDYTRPFPADPPRNGLRFTVKD